MPNLSELLSKIFRPQAGQNARTPSFIPGSVGRDIGAKMGGTFARDAAVPSPEAMTPPRSVPAAPTAPVEAATAIATPRIASPAMESSINIAAPDRGLERSRQEALRSGDPIAQKRYEYVTEDGMPKRTWKDALKNIGLGALQGAGSGGGLGGIIGGAATAGITGAVSPRMGREYQFNSMQLPRLLQDQQRQQEQAYNQAQIGRLGAQAQRDNAQTEIAQRNADLAKAKFEQEADEPYKVGDVLVDRKTRQPIFDARKKTPAKRESMGGIDYIWDDAAGKYNPVLDAKGNPVKSTNVITAGMSQDGRDADRKSRESLAQMADNTRRQIAVLNEGGRSERNEAKKAENEKAQEWLDNLANAIEASNGNKDTDAIKNAINQLQKFPNIETGIGAGDWPYAKIRGTTPAAGGKMGAGKRILASKLKAAGQTRQAAEAAGYTVVED